MVTCVGVCVGVFICVDVFICVGVCDCVGLCVGGGGVSGGEVSGGVDCGVDGGGYRVGGGVSGSGSGSCDGGGKVCGVGGVVEACLGEVDLVEAAAFSSLEVSVHGARCQQLLFGGVCNGISTSAAVFDLKSFIRSADAAA